MANDTEWALPGETPPVLQQRRARRQNHHTLLPQEERPLNASGIAQFVKEANRLHLEHDLRIQYVMTALHYANPQITDESWASLDPILTDIVVSFLNEDSFVSNACCFCY